MKFCQIKTQNGMSALYGVECFINFASSVIIVIFFLWIYGFKKSFNKNISIIEVICVVALLSLRSSSFLENPESDRSIVECIKFAALLTASVFFLYEIKCIFVIESLKEIIVRGVILTCLWLPEWISFVVWRMDKDRPAGNIDAYLQVGRLCCSICLIICFAWRLIWTRLKCGLGDESQESRRCGTRDESQERDRWDDDAGLRYGYVDGDRCDDNAELRDEADRNIRVEMIFSRSKRSETLVDILNQRLRQKFGIQVNEMDEKKSFSANRTSSQCLLNICDAASRPADDINVAMSKIQECQYQRVCLVVFHPKDMRVALEDKYSRIGRFVCIPYEMKGFGSIVIIESETTNEAFNNIGIYIKQRNNYRANLL